MVRLRINNNDISAVEGQTVAAVLVASGIASFRRSVNGSPRGPLCGVGVCFECRLTIDGVAHQRSCNILVSEGMEVVTDE